MLPVGNRLARRRDFTAAVRGGRRAGRPLLVVHLSQVPAEGAEAVKRPSGPPAPHRSDSRPVDERGLQPRIGFVVSKAVGGAVVRNTVKRRLRHIARSRINRLPPGSLLVVRALPPAAHATSAELSKDLDSALSRLLGSWPSPETPEVRPR
ncbi:MAG: ribonuclease P protein component [Carbonactinosporaceae bacterium]